MRVHGIAFIGDAAEEVENTLVAFGGAPRLGRLPRVEHLDQSRLAAAFRASFDLTAFDGGRA
jgi:dethiobiotin synthetase